MPLLYMKTIATLFKHSNSVATGSEYFKTEAYPARGNLSERKHHR